jgi:Acyl-CoA dehydrogenase, C-terminal domain
MSDNVAERFYRDVRLLRLYEGTSQIRLINSAKRTVAAAQRARGRHPIAWLCGRRLGHRRSMDLGDEVQPAK